MQTARRIPVWKVVAAIAVSLVLVSGLVALYVRSAIERRWEKTGLLARGLIAEAKTRDPRRPVLSGDPLPGNAWDDYRAAMALLNGVRSGEFKEVMDAASGDPGAARMTVALHREALALLRRGARRTEAVAMDLGKGFDDAPGLLGPARLAQLARCSARLDLEDGRAGEAMETLLAAAQFGRDQFQGTLVINAMIGSHLLKEIMDELESGLLDGRWSPDVLWVMERSLGILHEGLPSYGEVLLNERAAWGAELLLEGPEVLVPWLETWRQAFSRRLVVAGAYDFAVERAREASACRSWGAFRDLSLSETARMRDHPNPFVRKMAEGDGLLLRPAGVVRERRARLQLLRLGAHYRATGEVLALEDPFGGTLRTSVKDGRLTAWSIGPDGLHEDAPGPLRIELEAPPPH